jgi:hypothetical protein
MNEEEAVGTVSAVPSFSRSRRAREPIDEEEGEDDENADEEYEEAGAVHGSQSRGQGRAGTVERGSTGTGRRSRTSVQTYGEEEDEEGEEGGGGYGEIAEDYEAQEYDYASRLVPSSGDSDLGYEDISVAELEIGAQTSFLSSSARGKTVSKA